VQYALTYFPALFVLTQTAWIFRWRIICASSSSTPQYQFIQVGPLQLPVISDGPTVFISKMVRSCDISKNYILPCNVLGTRNHKNLYRFISQYIDVIITLTNILKYKSVNSSIAPVSFVHFRDVTLAISPFEWLWTDIYVQIFWQRHLLNSMIRPSFLVLSSLWGA